MMGEERRGNYSRGSIEALAAAFSEKISELKENALLRVEGISTLLCSVLFTVQCQNAVSVANLHGPLPTASDSAKDMCSKELSALEVGIPKTYKHFW
jgi:hypothetical protein